MSTTLLFVELLIIGLHVCVWLFMLVVLAFGTNWLSVFNTGTLSNWSTLLTVLIFSFTYSLGIIFDRLADTVYSKWDQMLKGKEEPDHPYSITKLKAKIGEKYKIFEDQLGYTKTRIRIARASSLNFGISTVLACLLILFRFKTNFVLIFVIAEIGFAITVSAVYAWYRLTKVYLGIIEKAYGMQASPIDSDST